MTRDYHLHLISDATGETLNTVAKAVAAQFEGTSAREHIYSLVRTERQLLRAIEHITANPENVDECPPLSKSKRPACVSIVEPSAQRPFDIAR